MRALLGALAAIACTSCDKPAAQGQPTTDPIQIRLDQIARNCHVPASIFRRTGKDELTFQPSPNEKYERVDCALTEFNKANLPLRLGFVGNEYYIGNEE